MHAVSLLGHCSAPPGHPFDSYGQQDKLYGRPFTLYGQQYAPDGHPFGPYGRQNEPYGHPFDSHGQQNEPCGHPFGLYGQQNGLADFDAHPDLTHDGPPIIAPARLRRFDRDWVGRLPLCASRYDAASDLTYSDCLIDAISMSGKRRNTATSRLHRASWDPTPKARERFRSSRSVGPLSSWVGEFAPALCLL